MRTFLFAAMTAIALAGCLGTDRASRLMDELAGQTIADDLAPMHALLAADLALQQGAPDRVLELLFDMQANHFDPESISKFHLLRARAYEDTNRFLDAARERAMLDDTLVDANRQAANHSALWDALVRTDRVRRDQEQPAATGAFIGWLRLAAIFEKHRSAPAFFEHALLQWQTAFPTHPANMEIAATILGVVRESARQPKHIALLLPFHSDFAEAADAIRNGFLAAWYADVSNTQPPAIEIHDTSFEAIEVVYAHAVEAGADFVVGPLRRGPVTSLACGETLLVTTLALNETSETAASTSSTGESAHACGPKHAVPDLYHFALTPEAEARQVAERAWFDGFGKTLAFTRDDEWGERVYQAFADEWERLGGIVLDHRPLPSTAIDVGKPIEEALGVFQSNERARNVSDILERAVEHEPRRRQDIDFVFMAAFPVDARQFKPRLAFHHGAQLPVYSTSHAHSGARDPTHGRDLEGVVFGDMPWLIAPTQADRALREQLHAVLARQDSQFPRLHAFGADAYRLAIGLRRIVVDRFARIDGHTGQLSVGANHRIMRRLAWARFADGLPTPYDSDAASVELPSTR